MRENGVCRASFGSEAEAHSFVLVTASTSRATPYLKCAKCGLEQEVEAPMAALRGPKAGELTWRDADQPGLREAWCDQLLVGQVLERFDGTVFFDATLAANMSRVPGVPKGSGSAPSVQSGQRSVEKAWQAFLQVAGMVG